jgi:hypothetical protein
MCANERDIKKYIQGENNAYSDYKREIRRYTTKYVY